MEIKQTKQKIVLFKYPTQKKHREKHEVLLVSQYINENFIGKLRKILGKIRRIFSTKIPTSPYKKIKHQT